MYLTEQPLLFDGLIRVARLVLVAEAIFPAPLVPFELVLRA